MDKRQMAKTNSKLPIVKFTLNGLQSDAHAKAADDDHLTFKITQNDQRLLTNLFTKHGFKEVHTDSALFNVMWSGSPVLVSMLQDMSPIQKINHFPRTTELTRKDRLVHNMQRMQQSTAYAKKKYDFLPDTYLIPNELQLFERAFRREKGLWIVKPAALSRGRGIYVINHPKQLVCGESVIVSKYICNPLLVEGFKFDLRLYVLVTSFDPLIIYLYEEGLARFATLKYSTDGKHIKDLCVHLTNYSINRHSDHYIRCEDPNVDNIGNKWSLSALLRTLASLGHDVHKLVAKIEDVVIKTIISAEMSIAQACRAFVPHRGNCFELYGFDILIDEKLKPWLLEVNMSPSLNCDAPIDLKIKSQLLVDLMNVIGVACQSPVQAKKEQHIKMYNNGRYIWKRIAKQNDKCRPPSSLHRKLTAEENRLVNLCKEEEARASDGSFIRIFPAQQTWQLYSQLVEDASGYNRMLHEQLYGKSPDRNVHLPQACIKNSKSFSSIASSDGKCKVYNSPGHMRGALTSLSKSQSVLSIPFDDAQQVTLRGERKKLVLEAVQEIGISAMQATKALCIFLDKILATFSENADYIKSLDDELQVRLCLQMDSVVQLICNQATDAQENTTDNWLPFQEKLNKTRADLNSFMNAKMADNNGIDQTVFEAFLSSASQQDVHQVLTFSAKVLKLSLPWTNRLKSVVQLSKLVPNSS